MKNPISWRRMGVLLAAWLCCAAALRAQDSGALEPEVKAAFLFNFVKFVEWPEGVLGPEGAPLTVCLQAGDPSAVTIEAVLRNKSVNGRPVRVQRLNRPQKSCHVVFSESGNAKRAAEIIEAVKGTPALTIGEGEPLMSAGGIIRILRDGKKLAFEVNMDAASRAGLKVSSRLLALGKITRDSLAQKR